jgi:hypothetical protein
VAKAVVGYSNEAEMMRTKMTLTMRREEAGSQLTTSYWRENPQSMIKMMHLKRMAMRWPLPRKAEFDQLWSRQGAGRESEEEQKTFALTRSEATPFLQRSAAEW